MAAAKASLSRAYETSVPPRLFEVAPDGTDELWAVGDVMMVIPVVPPDCPPQLEYALRLRRDALLTGTCDKCGAVAEFEMAPIDFDPPVMRSIFNHKMSCPGRDAAVDPMLRDLREARDRETEEERFYRAQRATRSVIAPLKDTGRQVRGQAGENLANELLELLLKDGARCEHLATDPYQTWYTFIAVGDWRCNECYAKFERGLPGSLDALEEHTCDICRRYTPSDLTALVMRIDFFVLRGAACGRCNQKYGEEYADDGKPRREDH